MGIFARYSAVSEEDFAQEAKPVTTAILEARPRVLATFNPLVYAPSRMHSPIIRRSR